MPGFAAIQGDGLNPGPAFKPMGPAPIGTWDSLSAVFDDETQTRNVGVREEATRSELWTRHRAAETAAGKKLTPSLLMIEDPAVTRGLDPLAGEPGLMELRDIGQAAGALDAEAYEEQIEAARKATPSAFGKVETREQLAARLDARFKAIRARAGQAMEQHPIAGFLGGMAGAMTDPTNLLATVFTGGVGGGRSLGIRMLQQAAVNTGIEAVQVPGRAADTRFGGPKYTPGEAVADVTFAAAGGAGFELLGTGVRAALRTAGRERPELRAAVAAVDEGVRDDAVLGTLRGADRDAAHEALAMGRPPPAVEPDRDLGDLFSPEAGGGPDVAVYKGRPIYAQSFDPAGLATDAQRFQYKADADGEGVTPRLKGVEAWDPLAAGRVLVWENRAGAQFVADGHQRFGLIRRLNDDRGFEHSLDGYLFREADGWRAEDLRVVAALKNIREGSGSPMDAAKVFRDAPEALNDRSLPVTGDFMAAARGLASLDEEAFRATVNRVIDERYAAEIGRNAAGRPDLHMDMVRLMKAADPANLDEARALVVEALQDDWIKAQGSQEDLFGYDPSLSAMIGRAKVAAAVKRQLGRDARLFGQLVKNADAIEAGGNALARDLNEARLAMDRAALEVSAKLALRHGPIGEAMAAAAKKVTAGETPGKASASVIKALRAALEAGERLDDLRGVAIDPKPPSAAQDALLAPFDDPHGEGAKAQVREAAEDVALDDGGTEAMAAGIDRVLDDASRPGNATARAMLGETSDWLVEAARDAGLDLAGFQHVIDAPGVRHVVKNHGDAVKETARGQVAVTDEDFRALPALLAAPDRIAFGAKDKTGKDLILTAKAQADGSTLVIEQVRTGKKHLALWSMWRVPGTIDDARLGKLADPNVRNDAGALKIVHPPQGASAVVDAAPPPGLFDDLDLLPEVAAADKADRAHSALQACVPGDGE